MDIFPYMGTQCLNINRTSCIVGTVSVKEVTLPKSGYIYAGLLNWFLRLCEVMLLRLLLQLNNINLFCLPSFVLRLQLDS